MKNRHISAGAIVVNYGPLSKLEGCLNAIERQEEGFDRVVIIDNNSPGINELLSFSLQESWEFIKLNENVGFAAANNIAVRMLVDCTWVALINPDACLDPDWLKNMSAATRKYTDYSFFASRLMMAYDSSRLDGIGDIYHMCGMVWRNGNGIRFDPVGNMEVFSPCAAAAFYNRNTFLEAGGFDHDFFCFVEDVDLGFRLRLMGHRCMFVSNAVAWHVGSTSTGGRHSDFSIYHGHRNLVWAFVKNMPGLLLWIFLPMHLMLNIVSLIWFSARGKARIIILSKIDAVRGLSVMLRKRKNIQSHRKLTAVKILSALDRRVIPSRYIFRGTDKKR